MNSKEKLELLSSAYVTKKVEDERERITVLSDALPEEAHKAILDIQFKLNEETGTFELDYEIMSDACGIVADTDMSELSEADFYENECSSVYTATRLSYINLNNQSDISEIGREYGVDIAEAAAHWYDEKVIRACEMLRDWVLEGEEEE